MSLSSSFAPVYARLARIQAIADRSPRRTACGLAALATLVCCGKAPYLFGDPRFWAEEGMYFQAALDRSLWDAVFAYNAVPYNPYYQALARWGTAAAAYLVPLESAPALTLWLCVGVYLGVFYLIFHTRVPELNGIGWRVFAAACLIFSTTNFENWFNTLGAHFLIVYACAFLLLEIDGLPERRLAAHGALYTFLALITTVAVALFPALVWLARRDWHRYRFHLGGLGAVTAFQIAVTLSEPAGPRGHAFDWPAIGVLVWNKFVVLGYLGVDASAALAARWFALDAGAQAWVGGAALLLAAAAGGAALYVWRGDRVVMCLLLAFGSLVGLTVLASVDQTALLVSPMHGSRYTLLPIAWLWLGTGVVAARLRARPLRALAVGLVALGMITGLRFYPLPPLGRSWAEQVRVYRADPTQREIHTWPELGRDTIWKVVLPAPPADDAS